LISRLVGFDPGILEQQPNTGGAPIVTRPYKGSVSTTALQVNINVRMRQEEGDNGVMAILTSS